MSQQVSASFAAKNASASKNVDYAIVIAGWPTVYTVARGDYPLAGVFSQFSGIQAWADLPVVSGANPRGRPEEGGFTIGQAQVTILDRRASGVRQLSDLLSRQAFFNAYGSDTNLVKLGNNVAIDATAFSAGPTISPADFSAGGGTLHVGYECMHYSSYANGSFTIDARGYRMTTPSYHPAFYSSPTAWLNIAKNIPYGNPIWVPTGEIAQVWVSPQISNLNGRQAFIYKGYQDLPLDQWSPTFGGVVVGAVKNGPSVTLTIMESMWATHGDGEAFLFGPTPAYSQAQPLVQTGPYGTVWLGDWVLSDDFSNVVVTTDAPTATLSNGHYLANLGGHWVGIVRAT